MGHSGSYDYLRTEAAERLVDRLRDVSRHFPRVLDIGAGHGALLQHLGPEFGVETIVQVDSAEAMMHRDRDLPTFAPPPGVELHRLVHDEELLVLPPGSPEEATAMLSEATQGLLQPGSFDCVISNLALHWVNDLPGVLAQARHLLKPDGLFLAVMLGGDTLHELRAAFAIAEQERDGGVSPWVSPQVGVDDAGSLLTRAGFTLLTVDTDQIVVPFPDAITLVHELSAMGEANAVHMRRKSLPRETLVAAAALYQELHGDPAAMIEDPPPDTATTELDQTSEQEQAVQRGVGQAVVPATFELIYMIGWAPSQAQPQPLPRGSATQTLAAGVLGASGVEDAAGGPPGKENGANEGDDKLSAAGAENSKVGSSPPTPFSLADIARQTGGQVGRVTVSNKGTGGGDDGDDGDDDTAR